MEFTTRGPVETKRGSGPASVQQGRRYEQYDRQMQVASIIVDDRCRTATSVGEVAMMMRSVACCSPDMSW